MTFLLDTTTFSDLMREHPKVEARVAGLALTDRVVICCVVRGEIRYGIDRLPPGKRPADLETKAARLFAAVVCEPVPEAAGDQYARVKITRERKGLALDENDLWIAATALVLEATLVSRDGDFQQVEGLEVQDWTTD